MPMTRSHVVQATLMLAGLLFVAAAPAEAQRGNQSDITGVNTTSSSTSSAPSAPAPSPTVTATVTSVQQAVSTGTLTVDGAPVSVTVQTGLADIFQGNTASPAAQSFAAALGTGGPAVVEGLSVFIQDPSGANFNSLADAWNAAVEGADASALASEEFAATFSVLSEIRASF